MKFEPHSLTGIGYHSNNLNHTLSPEPNDAKKRMQHKMSSPKTCLSAIIGTINTNSMNEKNMNIICKIDKDIENQNTDNSGKFNIYQNEYIITTRDLQDINCEQEQKANGGIDEMVHDSVQTHIKDYNSEVRTETNHQNKVASTEDLVNAAITSINTKQYTAARVLNSAQGSETPSPKKAHRFEGFKARTIRLSFNGKHLADEGSSVGQPLKLFRNRFKKKQSSKL